jgi:uncharacterized protein with ATP-grasp and redox domains
MTIQYQETEEERIEEHNKYLDNLDKYCNNCGRIHTGRLVEEHLDGDNKPIEIVICNGPVFIDKEYERARAQRIVDNIPPDFEEDNNEDT